jgi:hypothetical protein
MFAHAANLGAHAPAQKAKIEPPAKGWGRRLSGVIQSALRRCSRVILERGNGMIGSIGETH